MGDCILGDSGMVCRGHAPPALMTQNPWKLFSFTDWTYCRGSLLKKDHLWPSVWFFYRQMRHKWDQAETDVSVEHKSMHIFCRFLHVFWTQTQSMNLFPGHRHKVWICFLHNKTFLCSTDISSAMRVLPRGSVEQAFVRSEFLNNLTNAVHGVARNRKVHTGNAWLNASGRSCKLGTVSNSIKIYHK